jgi:hypothetical protein
MVSIKNKRRKVYLTSFYTKNKQNLAATTEPTIKVGGWGDMALRHKTNTDRHFMNLMNS